MRGLGNRTKRKAIMHYLKDKQLDIAFLQETHSTNKLLKQFEIEWGNKWFAASGTSQARGVAIVFKNKSSITVNKSFVDHEGRYVICNVSMDGTEYTLCNLYAPNEDSPKFFEKLFKIIDKVACENVIIGGDFNLTLDPELDRLNSLYNNRKATEFVKKAMETFNMEDIWRNRNPENKRYTWYKRHNGMSASRIDYFLVNQGVSPKIKNMEISWTNRTDHSLVTMSVEDNTLKRGPGIWKLNNTLLKDDNFCELIKTTIGESESMCNRTGWNPIQKWEFIKGRICKKARKFGKNRSQQKRTLLSNFNRLMNEIQKEKDKWGPTNTVDYTEIAEKITELEQDQVAGSLFRSRCQWARLGERNSKYFFNLEKRNYNNKTMFAIFDDKGNICKNQKYILQQQQKFYQTLYTSDPDVNFNLRNHTGIGITQQQKEYLDRPLNIQELHQSLMSMQNGKVPGIDGLGKEFYVHFWEELKDILWETYGQILTEGKLNPSARMGIISLLPKKGKDTRYIQHNRPLTLLSLDYKILAKALTLRMKPLLPNIIGTQQTGFVQGRSIHTNIRKTMDIIAHINQTGKKAVIVSIDFHKCFDRIEHNSIFEAFRYFNFGETFINWVKIFFNKFQVRTQNAGFCSEPFLKTRGVNQGCPISPSCFILCGEIMAHQIITNPWIRGVKVGRSEVENTILQFADDTGLFIMYSEECISAVIDTLSHIEKATGLMVSYDKTCIYRIGSLRNSDAMIYTTKPIKWSDGDINMLGVTIRNSPHQNNVGFDSIIDKMANVASIWYYRTLTIIGKIEIINTLMSSLFIYQMYNLPLMSKGQIHRIDNIILDFLWNGKKSKIPFKLLHNLKKRGGLQLVDINVRHKTMHLQWIKILHEDNSLANYVYDWLVPELREKIWSCNIRSTDVCKICEYKTFWSEILKEWAEINFVMPQNIEEVKGQILWCNSNLKQNNKVIMPVKKYVEVGIWKIQDLINEEGQFLTFPEIQGKYCNISIDWLWYCSMIASIPREWKDILSNNLPVNKLERFNYNQMIETKKPSRILYRNFILQAEYDITKYLRKWCESLNMYIELEDYYKYFSILYKQTDIVKYRNFQYRLLLTKIFTNDTLYKWKIVDSSNCDWCSSKQTNIHLFIKCPAVWKLWEYVRNLFKTDNCKWEPYNIIFNDVHTTVKHVSNVITGITKFFIFKQKCGNINPSIKSLRKEIIDVAQIHIYNSKYKSQGESIRKVWSTVVNKINEER